MTSWQKYLLNKISFKSTKKPKTIPELKKFLKNTANLGFIEPDILSMLEGVLQISTTQARDIMIPKNKMVILHRDMSAMDILDIVIKSGHSRFPVIGDNQDDIIGILLAKDLLLYAFNKINEFKLRDILHQAVIIPESKRLNILLKEFRQKRNHLAIVVDKYGAISGLITIEDILEQIVGNIKDEHDIEKYEQNIIKLSNDIYIINCLTTLKEFNKYFNTNFLLAISDTIGGFVINKFGYLPKVGETITIDNLEFTIKSREKRRLHLLEAKRIN